MTEAVLAEVLSSAVAGYWGKDPGAAEVDVRVIRNGDVQPSGHLRWDEIPVRGFTKREAEKATVVPGDLVITTSGYCGQVAYIDRALDFALCASNFVRVLRPNESVVNGRYLFHLLNSQESQNALAPFIRGTTMKNLSFGKAAEHVRVPLPPLEEQKRIAAILDKADDLLAKRRAAIAHLDALTQAIFIDMFGERRSGNWDTLPIGEVAEVQIGPFGSLLHSSDYTSGGIPLINPMHIIDGRLVPREDQTVDPEAAERLGRYALRPGDVVLGRRGEMGRCALVPRDAPELLCGSGSMIVRPDPSRLKGIYLSTLLASDAVKRKLEQGALGVTMMNLNATTVKQLEVLVPPLSAQHAFEGAALQVDRALHKMASAASLQVTAGSSLQHRAFRGEL